VGARTTGASMKALGVTISLGLPVEPPEAIALCGCGTASGGGVAVVGLHQCPQVRARDASKSLVTLRSRKSKPPPGRLSR
jgi:hypothetical protein